MTVTFPMSYRRWRIRAAGLVASAFMISGIASAQGAVITVGAGGGYDHATLSAAIAAAQANDTISIAAGLYLNDFASITIPLTIQGTGGVAVLKASILIPNGKAFLITNANVTIRYLEFQGAAVTDENGAGIRAESGNLVVENSTFRDNENGILSAGNPTATITVTGSTFINNGLGGDGHTHGIYAGTISTLTVSDSTFAGTNIGHDIKSRAANTIVTNNILDDGVSGTTSYAIDIANAGVATITGNTITQGPNTDNKTMVSYGAEGTQVTNSLNVANNNFVNFASPTTIGVFNHTSVIALLTDNTFTNVTLPLVGPGQIVTTPQASVPEPGAFLLLGLGLAGFVFLRRPAGRLTV